MHTTIRGLFFCSLCELIKSNHNNTYIEAEVHLMNKRLAYYVIQYYGYAAVDVVVVAGFLPFITRNDFGWRYLCFFLFLFYLCVCSFVVGPEGER